MEQRWGLPLIAWPSRLRPNLWDLVALPMVLGAIALVAWGGMAMSARYHVGEVLPVSLDPWRLPEYALRTVLRIAGTVEADAIRATREALRPLVRVGFDEIAIDPPWHDLRAARRVIAELAAALS